MLSRWLFAFCLLVAAAAAQAASKAEMALHALDYIGIDYPDAVRNGKIINREEYREQLEFAQQVARQLRAEGASELIPRVTSLVQAIEKRQPASKIRELTLQLKHAIVERFGITTAPRKTPDLAIGKRLYSQHCASCHGVSGAGNGPQGRSLNPPPTDFTEWRRQSRRSLYGLYSTITQGVDGTGMRAFTGLDSRQRWALAFYVSQFVFNDAQRKRGEALWRSGKQPGALSSLKRLTRVTPAQIKQSLGEDGLALLAWLRSNPKALEKLQADPLDVAHERMQQSLAAWQAGKPKQAYQLALSAYLDGFELAESALRAASASLVRQVEAAMIDYRSALRQADAQQVRETYHKALMLLGKARELMSRNTMSPRTAFVSALVILLREGLEAILILAAISSVLIKSGRRDALWFLHLGWIAAIALGIVTWYVSENIISISGAGREMTEGVTALLATVVLLYVGFWLHGKTHAVRWQQFIREKIQKALHGGALWVLASISFLAVYREIFETVLFYQALYQQTAGHAATPLLGGIAVGAAILVVLTLIILRTSLRLPLKLFFQINSGIMLLLAFMFAGHGVAGLQKAGVIDVTSVPGPELSLLGIYPTLQTLATQGVLLLIFIVYFVREHRARRRLEAQQP